MRRSNGGSRGPVASAAALTAALLLGGCTQQVSVPEATPVDGKLCALSDSAGFDDQGLNRELYVALQKAKVAWGVPLSLYSLAATETHEDARARLQKLVDGNCTVILASGDFLSTDVLAVASANPVAKFVLSDHHFVASNPDVASTQVVPANVHYIANQLAEPAFLAGYLAAMSSQSNFVAVLPAIASVRTPLQTKLEKAFRAGVTYYSNHGGEQVQVKVVEAIPKIGPVSAAIKLVLQGLVDSGVDRVFVLAAKDFETVATVSEEFKELQLIGTERDWALVKSTSKHSPRILASIVRAKNVNSIYQQIGYWLGKIETLAAPDAIEVNDLINQGTIVTDAHDIAYPAGYQAAIEPLTALLTSDQGMTK